MKVVFRTAACPVGVLAAVLAFSPSAHADRIDACADAYERAQELRLTHKLRAARKQLEICVANICPQSLRRDCVPWLREVSNSMPSIVIDTSVGTEATIDGERATVGGTVEVDPGTHHIVVTDPLTNATATADVTVNEGEKKHRVALTVPTATVAPAPPQAPAKKPGPPFYTWIVGGVGVAGMISFAAWGISALSLESDLRTSCYGTCSPIDVERVHNRALVADISLAIGVVGLVAAGVIFFWPRHAKVEDKAQAAAHLFLDGIRF